MKNNLKLMTVLGVVALASVAGQAVLANCVEPSGQVYEVRQCAKRTWFAALPGGATIASTQWWALGFGNTGAVQSGANTSSDGSAFVPTPLPGVFIGMDSGNLDAVGLDLVDAAPLGIGAPAGTKCFSSRANWGAPGVDSCIDANRNDTAGFGAASGSDSYLNIYWDTNVGVGTRYFNHQLDPPMGVLLKDSTGTRFALAFFASQTRNQDPNDLTSGELDMGALVNGDPGPSGNNVVAWQSVPEPNTSSTLSNPADTNSPRNVTMTWTAARVITDNSTRPCFQSDGVTPCTSLGGATGVGVNDQGPLVHYEMESAALNTGTNTCDTTWTVVPGTTVNHPATTTSASGIAPNTCLRLRTRFGRTPSASFNPAATTTARDANRLAAQTGTLGDLGYSVSSTARRIGGATVSQNAVLTVATRNKNTVTVTWNTTSELSVTGFDIVGIDAKGARKVVASSVACKACTTGLGASYTELVAGNKFEGSKKVAIVMQPSGVTSNSLDLK